MTEHKICKECKWNKYPLCQGTIMDNGEYMNIENLKPNFQCGQKEEIEVENFSIIIKSDLEKRIEALEEKTKDLSVSPK